jgi:hypothetical protein
MGTALPTVFQVFSHSLGANRGTPFELTVSGPRTRTGPECSSDRTAAMSKVAGAMIAMFAVGAVGMTLLGSILGPYAEAATVALLGVGLFTGSSVLGSGKETSPAGVAKEA